MTIDLPHMIVTILLLFAIVWFFNHSGAVADMAKGKKTLIQFATIFVIIFILNFFWPYGGGT